jgi:hypothetical protein
MRKENPVCTLTTLMIRHLLIPRRRSRTTRVQLLTRRDAGHALKAAMTIPALAGSGRDAEPLKVPK